MCGDAKSRKAIIEILGLFLLTYFCSFYISRLFLPFIPSAYTRLLGIITHLPMFVILWIWFGFRGRKLMGKATLWLWPKDSGRPLLFILLWLIPLQIIGNLDIIGKPLPFWFQGGWGSISLELFFQGLFVGFSEEMLLRPTIHQMLLSTPLRKTFSLRKWRISIANILTAFLFGLMHLGNVFTQPLGYTLMQVVYASVLGIIIGFYYEKTKNFMGAAFIHNSIDIVQVFVVLGIVWFDKT